MFGGTETAIMVSTKTFMAVVDSFTLIIYISVTCVISVPQKC